MVAAPVFAALALALGIWNVALRNDLDSAKSRLAAGTTVHLGDVGNVVADGSRATLYASIRPAPPGKIYEAWVIANGKPLPAGTFEGGGRVELQLTQPVRPGDQIAVTIEPDPGTQRPTGQPIASGKL
jgi:hypothetical protein